MRSVSSVGACLFALARISWPERARRWILDHRLQIWLLAAVAYTVYVLAAFTSPSPLQLLSRLTPASTYALGLVTIALYLGAAIQYWRVYSRSGRRFERTTGFALLLLAEAVVPMTLSPVWNLSWWLYHLFMLIAFSIAVIAVVQEYEEGCKSFAEGIDCLQSGPNACSNSRRHSSGRGWQAR